MMRTLSKTIARVFPPVTTLGRRTAELRATLGERAGEIARLNEAVAQRDGRIACRSTQSL